MGWTSASGKRCSGTCSHWGTSRTCRECTFTASISRWKAASGTLCPSSPARRTPSRPKSRRQVGLSVIVMILIIKRISRAPIYLTRWEYRALCNSTNNTHTHTHAHARTRTRTHTHTHARIHTHIYARRGDRHGCEKSLETGHIPSVISRTCQFIRHATDSSVH